MQVNLSLSAVMEFDLGADAAREVTEATDRALFEAIIQAPSLTTVAQLPGGITQLWRATTWRTYSRSDLMALSPRAKNRIFKAARSGERVAAVLGAAEGRALLGRFGYIPGASSSEMCRHIAASWAECFNAIVSAPSSAIVFGHDFDPLFFALRVEPAL